MPTPAEILNDPNYIGANEATKQAIFDKHVRRVLTTLRLTHRPRLQFVNALD